MYEYEQILFDSRALSEIRLENLGTVPVKIRGAYTLNNYPVNTMDDVRPWTGPLDPHRPVRPDRTPLSFQPSRPHQAKIVVVIIVHPLGMDTAAMRAGRACVGGRRRAARSAVSRARRAAHICRYGWRFPCGSPEGTRGRAPRRWCASLVADCRSRALRRKSLTAIALSAECRGTTV